LAELPFVEKYRPVSLDDLCGDHNIQILKAFARSGNFPLAMIFYGPYGTGKTTAAKALVRDYYVLHGLYLPSATFRDVRSGTKVAPEYEGIFPPVLYVDASITRDIDTIRGLVHNFMKTVAPAGLVKFVIFDEADRLGYDAQRALRALLEKYPKTRTIYTTNELEKIDPAIRSRAAGGIFEFKYPSVEEVTKYLQKICAKEGVVIPDETLRKIAAESESVREAVGRLGTEIALKRVEEMPKVPVQPPIKPPPPAPAPPPAEAPAVPAAEKPPLETLVERGSGPLKYGLHHGSATYINLEPLGRSIEEYTGDFTHVESEKILENAHVLRRIYKILAPEFKEYKPWGCSKDYEDTVYLFCQEHVPNAPILRDNVKVQTYEYNAWLPYVSHSPIPMPPEKAPKIEEFVKPTEEEKPVEEVPGPIEAHVHLEVDTYLKKTEKGEYKLSPHDPHYIVLFTAPSEVSKPPEERWQLTMVGIPNTAQLDEYLAKGEDFYDLAESMRMAFGTEWDAIREALKENPPPFNQFTSFHLTWKPEDIEWTPLAKKMHDIYHYKYAEEELRGIPTKELQLIAIVKGAAKGKNREELISNILAKQAYAEEITKGIPLEVPIQTVEIYNPTYGALFTVDLTKTLPESEVWVMSYASPDRPLKESEKKALMETGKIGVYPDEFYLVGREGLTRELVLKHQEQIKRYEKANEQGETYPWVDRDGNPRDKVYVPFVPGPMVDIINNNPDAKAVEFLLQFMLDWAQKKYQKTRSFQDACLRHARKLVNAVRQVAPYPEFKLKFPWAVERKPSIEAIAEEALGELESLAGEAVSELEEI